MFSGSENIKVLEWQIHIDFCLIFYEAYGSDCLILKQDLASSVHRSACEEEQHTMSNLEVKINGHRLV